MSQTLVISTPDGSDICLPRINSLLTTSAQLQRHDRMEIADMQFQVIDVLHKLYAPPVAPTTFVRIAPLNKRITDEDVELLKGYGFRD